MEQDISTTSIRQRPSDERCIQARNTARLSLPTFPPAVDCRQTLAEACYHVLHEHATQTAAKMTSCRANRKFYTNLILRDLMELQIKASGFAVITSEAIQWMQNIIQDMRCLEVGAGHGLITQELTKRGCDVIATDPHFPEQSRYGFRNPLSPITKLDAVSAITKLPRPCLIWSWPEPEPYTADALSAFKGNHFIYVGESDDGCTGSPEFHEILNEDFRIEDTFSIPQYPNIHDRVYHFTRIR